MDTQGHRGARGLAPENTIEGFLLAAEMGVTTLEMDVVISADLQVLVSHEPFFSPEICLDPSGNPISYDSVINIYHLTYSEISQFDCGNLPHPRFPNQQKMKTVKPLLSAVIDIVEKLHRSHLRYNIELKSKAETDNLFHPEPEAFVQLVVDIIEKKGIGERVTIQSFDFRILQIINRKYPNTQLALLIENRIPWRSNLDSLGFVPAIYSPDYQLLSRSIVKEIQETGMKVIPWTVNAPEDIEKMLSWGVDGIISDYPDRVIEKTKK